MSEELKAKAAALYSDWNFNHPTAEGPLTAKEGFEAGYLSALSKTEKGEPVCKRCEMMGQVEPVGFISAGYEKRISTVFVNSDYHNELSPNSQKVYSIPLYASPVPQNHPTRISDEDYVRRVNEMREAIQANTVEREISCEYYHTSYDETDVDAAAAACARISVAVPSIDREKLIEEMQTAVNERYAKDLCSSEAVATACADVAIKLYNR